MHPQSRLKLLAPFLTFLTKAAANNSSPFELKSHVLSPTSSTLDGLYFTAFEYHPGNYFFGTITEASVSTALVSVLTGTAAQLAAGNGTLATSDIPDNSEFVYFDIAPGDPEFAPSVYDYVGLVPAEPLTYGLHFVGGVLTYQGLTGQFYGKFFGHT